MRRSDVSGQPQGGEPAQGGDRPIVFMTPLLPPIPGAMTSRDFLMMQLQIAAELEHALMVQYLYAAYSIGGSVAGKHPDRLRRWHDTLLTIAREEMGHLITVQNILLLVGGPVVFGRRHYPWSSPYYPFEFNLDPFTLKSLACYVYAEMPQVMARRADQEVRQRVIDVLGSDTRPQVGELYTSIIGLLGDRKAVPDSMFDTDSYRYQLTWDEFGRGYRPPNHEPVGHPTGPPPNERRPRVIVAQVTTRTEALAALRDVAGQGEAEELKPHDETEPSHFDRFAELFRDFDGILKDDPDWSPSRPVPRNPYADQARDAPPDVTVIASRGSQAWARLFNLRYRMLLSLLTYIYRVPRDVAAPAHPQRAQLISRIFGEMYNMKALAGILVRLPLGDPQDAARAGPPFQVPYTLTPPQSETSFWRIHLDLLDATEGLVKMLTTDTFRAEMPGDGVRYLQAMREADRDTRDWIVTILHGIALGRRTGL